MSKSFFMGLAIDNLKKNRKIYIPYIAAGMFTVCVFYILSSLASSKSVAALSGGENVGMLLSFGMIVVGIFSVIFLFYTGNFLIKQRKKEFGVFNIMGMEKRHIAKVLCLESLVTSVITIGGGIFLGILLNKLLFLVLVKLAKITQDMHFEMNISSTGITVALFVVIYALILIVSVGRISLSSPMELLRGTNHGEKEPKAKWALAILGFIFMGAGYILAMTVDSPITAMSRFFIAVILVIIGTYLLFTVGSIVILKLLKKKKDFYYKPKNFISVSGMIYRMKQNAVGLANICILCTMVLVLMSTAVSIYAGETDLFNTRYKDDVAVHSEIGLSKEDITKAKEIIDSDVEKYGVDTKDDYEYKYISTKVKREGNTFNINNSLKTKISYMSLIPQEEWTYGKPDGFSLKAGEVAVCNYEGHKVPKQITIEGNTYKVKKVFHKWKGETGGVWASNWFVVFPNKQDVENIGKKSELYFGGELQYFRGFDFAGRNADAENFEKALKSDFKDASIGGAICEVKELEKDGFYGIFGGFLFLCVFLGAIFLMATVVIMYYKQLSEGMEDRARFDVMQKVGMSTGEIRKTIKSQILAVFFIPLIVAMIHVAGASPMMIKLLEILMLTDKSIYVASTFATIGIFALVYMGFYTLTAREYYRLVK